MAGLNRGTALRRIALSLRLCDLRGRLGERVGDRGAAPMKIIQRAIILALVGGLIVSTRAHASSLARTYTITLPYADDADPGRAINAAIALRQMQLFFDGTLLVPGGDYSFVHDVLGGALPSSRGYVDTGHGYGEGINVAASALN